MYGPDLSMLLLQVFASALFARVCKKFISRCSFFLTAHTQDFHPLEVWAIASAKFILTSWIHKGKIHGRSFT